MNRKCSDRGLDEQTSHNKWTALQLKGSFGGLLRTEVRMSTLHVKHTASVSLIEIISTFNEKEGFKIMKTKDEGRFSHEHLFPPLAEELCVCARH